MAAGRHLPRYLHAAGRRDDRRRRAAADVPRPAHPGPPPCSGWSTPTPWPWPRCCCSAVRWPTGSAAGGSSRPGLPRCSPPRRWPPAPALNAAAPPIQGPGRRARSGGGQLARTSTRGRRRSPTRAATGRWRSASWGAINGAAARHRAGARWTSDRRPRPGRAIFLVNLPIAAVAAVMTRSVLAESHGYRSPIDWAGAAFFTVCAATLTFALIHGGSNGWVSPHPPWGHSRSPPWPSSASSRWNSARPLSPARPGPVPSRFLSTLMAAAVLLTACEFAPFIYTQLWLQSVST